ncbi:winged helix-turn-helix transcriptional regulator [Nocardia sp. IFM 10818]
MTANARLERKGMIERVVTGTRPIAVEYRITALGRTLQELIDALLNWSTVALPEVEHARAHYDDRFDSDHMP